MLLKKMSLIKKVVASFAAISLLAANPVMAQSSGVAEEGGAPSVQGSTNQQIRFSNSINENAGESKAQHGMAVASSALSTAMMVVMAMEAQSSNPWMAAVFYGMAALSAVQGVMAMQGQKKSGNVQDLSGLGGYGGGTGGSGTDVNYDVDLPLPPGATDANGRSLGTRKVNAKDVLALAAKNGVKVNPKTGEITMPDGKKVSASTLSSPAGLESLGIDKGSAEAAFDALAAASSGFKAVRMDVDSSGGGGGGGKSNARSVSSYPGFKFPGFGEQSKAASVAGLTKMANGEPIGVAGDDIFKMMQRAYGSRQGHGMFIEE